MTTDNETKLAQVRQFAQDCRYEEAHSEQVLKLAVQLFEKLKTLHHLGIEELFLLQCAAVLHDIGWIEGQAGHHKISMRMILDADSLPLNDSQRKLTALIARYHRKALPKSQHAFFGELSSQLQEQIRWLSGILRIADGLDRSHMSVVKNIQVQLFRDAVEFRIKASGPAAPEIEIAQKKADLFEIVSGRKTRFVCKP